MHGFMHGTTEHGTAPPSPADWGRGSSCGPSTPTDDKKLAGLEPLTAAELADLKPTAEDLPPPQEGELQPPSDLP